MIGGPWAALGAVVVFAGWTGASVLVGKHWGEADLKDYQLKEAQAQKDVAAAKAKLADEAQNHTDDMWTTYQQGLKDGEAGRVKVVTRVQRETQQYASVFRNPACDMPQSSFDVWTAVLKGLRSGVALPPDSPIPNPTPSVVPAPVSTAPAPTAGPPPKPIPRKKAGG